MLVKSDMKKIFWYIFYFGEREPHFKLFKNIFIIFLAATIRLIKNIIYQIVIIVSVFTLHSKSSFVLPMYKTYYIQSHTKWDFTRIQFSYLRNITITIIMKNSNSYLLLSLDMSFSPFIIHKAPLAFCCTLLFVLSVSFSSVAMRSEFSNSFWRTSLSNDNVQIIRAAELCSRTSSCCNISRNMGSELSSTIWKCQFFNYFCKMGLKNLTDS